MNFNTLKLNLHFSLYFEPQYPVSKLPRALCSPEKFSVDGLRWTLNPSKEAMNCKIKHAKQFAVQYSCLQQFQIDETKITSDVEMKVLKINYSFLKRTLMQI